MTFEVTSAVYVEAVAFAQVVDVALPFSYPLAVVSVSYLDAVVSYAQYLDAVVVMGHLVYAAEPEPEPEPTDTTAPTLAITSGAASIYEGATTSLNFAFSEDVGATFTQADVVVSAGVGSSMYFDGSGDYLTLPNSSAFNFGTGDYTIEARVYSATVSGYHLIWGGSISGEVAFYINGSTLEAGRWGVVGIAGTGSGAISINTWHHVLMSRASGTVRMFVDGVLRGSASDTTDVFYSGLERIGVDTSGASAWDGYISNLRITKGVARHTANFTPPQEQLSLTGDPHAANVSLLINGEGVNNSTTFVDSSPVPKTITAFGNAKISTAQLPFRSGVLSNFTGSGSSYSATFKGTKVGTASISVASGAYADAAGNLGAAASLALDVLEVYPFFSIGSTQPYSALSSLMSMGSDPVTMEYKTVPFTIRFGEN